MKGHGIVLSVFGLILPLSGASFAQVSGPVTPQVETDISLREIERAPYQTTTVRACVEEIKFEYPLESAVIDRRVDERTYQLVRLRGVSGQEVVFFRYAGDEIHFHACPIGTAIGMKGGCAVKLYPDNPTRLTFRRRQRNNIEMSEFEWSELFLMPFREAASNGVMVEVTIPDKDENIFSKQYAVISVLYKNPC